MTKFPVWGPCQLIWFPWFGCRQSLISWKGMAKYTLSIQVKVLKNHFVISQPKNNFLDAQKSSLIETVLLSTQNKGSNGWKIASVLTILSIKVHLSGPMLYQTPLWKIIQLKIIHFIITEDIFYLTLKAPITTAADDKYGDKFPKFWKNKVWYFMRISWNIMP